MQTEIDLGFASLTVLAGPIAVIRFAPDLREVEREHLEALRARVEGLAGGDPAVVIVDDTDRRYALAPDVFALLVRDVKATARRSLGLVVPDEKRRASFVPIFPLLGDCRFFLQRDNALAWAREQIAGHPRG